MIAPIQGEAAAEYRVLVLTPRGRDGEVVSRTLTQAGLRARVCQHLLELCAEAREGAGAAIIATEALTPDLLPRLSALLAEQPAWSDLPIILLAPPTRSTREVERALLDLGPTGTATVLERPVHVLSMLTAVQMALRSRARQYQVRRQLVEQQRQAELLARSVADLENFAHVTAHDLKEPLRGIRLCIGFLLDDCRERLEGTDLERLRTLDTLADRMMQLLDATLRYSRVGYEPLRLERKDLGVLATEAAEGLRQRLEECGAEVTVQPSMPVAECDPALIRQIFANLIANAVKYNESTKRRVEVGALEGGQGPVVYVKDNGIGIPPQHHQSIFGMFKRLHGPERYGAGTGAGLAIVKRSVERHGGRVWVESQPGRGSVFYFTLGQPEGKALGVTVGESEAEPKAVDWGRAKVAAPVGAR